MGKLAEHITYLAGPMDEVSDNGVGWRKQITPKLWNMGIGVINPCDKPNIGFEEGPEFHAELLKAREDKDYDKITKMGKPIVGNDLRSVHKSDFIILYLDKSVFIFGTTVEFAWATQQRKPTLIVCPDGKERVSLFAYGMCPHKLMFSNFDEMFVYLQRVDDGLEEDLRRWYFFDHDKIFGRGKYAIY